MLSTAQKIGMSVLITLYCHEAPNRNNIPMVKKFPAWGWAKAGHRRELVECAILKEVRQQRIISH